MTPVSRCHGPATALAVARPRHRPQALAVTESAERTAA